MLNVTVYNLSVKLETRDQKFIEHVERFIAQHYTVKGQSYTANVATPPKKFYSRLADTGVFYLHTNQFIHLIHHFKEIGYELPKDTQRIDARDYTVQTHDYQVREGLELRDYQEEINNFLIQEPRKGSRMVVLQTGKGKAQPLTARIKTPKGWVRMKDIKLGSIITAQDGTPTRVTGVYPQGVKPVFNITLQDNRTTQASDEHLWKVYIEDKEIKKTTTQVITTLELKEFLYRESIRVYLDTIEPENPPPKYTNHDFNTTLRVIPNEILNGSLEQRYHLFQQLLQLGKHSYNPDGLIYKTKNYLHATTVVYLVRSLAGQAKLEETRRRNQPPSYKVTHININPHTLEKYKQGLHRHNRIEVKSVTQTVSEQVQCISIDHPSKLYVTDNFIVTHNTMISMWALAQIKSRIGIVVLSEYQTKWRMDVVQLHQTTAKEIMVINGSGAIRGIVAMARDNELTCPYYIFSSRTLQQFITHYEENPRQTELLYGCSPIELFPLLGIGSLLIDETHQQFHAIFKILIHTNVKYQIGLSATLISDDEVVSRVHKIVYPKACTYDGLELDRYADVYALSYSMPVEFARHTKTTNYGSNSYSHTAFEQSVIKFMPMRKFYTSLIDCTLKDFYIDKYEAGDTCMIFVATVKFAAMLADRYAQMYPDKVVKRYCEDDPFEYLLEGDIVVTTIISAGTAVDKPNLRTVIQTVSVASPVANIQNLGRLRKLEGKDTRFCYLFADNIPKQKQYHFKRVDLFRDRVATHKSFRARVAYQP